MLSPSARFVLSVLKAGGPPFGRLDLATRRRAQDHADILIRPAKGTSYERFLIAERVPAAWVRLKDAPADAALLYCHGGAFVAGGLPYARLLASKLAAVCGIPALPFAYRLAPEHPFPAALEDAMAAYEYILDSGISPERIVVAGESAGGNLALALPLALRDKGRPLPAALVALSPWTDIACRSEGFVKNADIDPSVDIKELMENARQYAGGQSPSNPLVSPYFGDFAGFPPTLFQVGTREVLLEDVTRTYEKMKAAGADARLEVYEELWHVFQIYEIPEAWAARESIGTFVRDILGLA